MGRDTFTHDTVEIECSGKKSYLFCHTNVLLQPQPHVQLPRFLAALVGDELEQLELPLSVPPGRLPASADFWDPFESWKRPGLRRRR